MIQALLIQHLERRLQDLNENWSIEGMAFAFYCDYNKPVRAMESFYRGMDILQEMNAVRNLIHALKESRP